MDCVDCVLQVAMRGTSVTANSVVDAAGSARHHHLGSKRPFVDHLSHKEGNTYRLMACGECFVTFSKQAPFSFFKVHFANKSILQK